MKKNVFIRLLLILIAIMCIGFSACKSTNDENINDDSNNYDDEKLVSDNPVTFSAFYTYSGYDVIWGEGEISKAITDITGISLDLIKVEGDQESVLKVMLSASSYPDILFSISNETLATYADANSLIAFDDYLETSGENIKKLFSNDLDKMRYAGDNKIYGFNRAYREVSGKSNASFNIQYDLLREFDYPDIETLDELYEFMLMYKSKYPSINGQETIGLESWADSYGLSITLTNPALRAGGFQNDGLYVVGDDLSVEYGLKNKASYDYFKWLNKLYLNGLYDEAGVIQNRSVFEEKIINGNVLVVTTDYWDLNEFEVILPQSVE